MPANQVRDVLEEVKAEGFEEGIEKGMEKGTLAIIASLIHNLPNSDDEAIPGSK